MEFSEDALADRMLAVYQNVRDEYDKTTTKRGKKSKRKNKS